MTHDVEDGRQRRFHRAVLAGGVSGAAVAAIRIPLAAIALTLEVFGSPSEPAAAPACAVTHVVTLRIQVHQSQPIATKTAQTEEHA